MNPTFKIAPSILSANFGHLRQDIESVIAAGADWIHVDVMDGHFVPNLTIGAPVVKSLRSIEGAFLDCHLMIEEPEKYVDDFIKAGADNITLHIESSGDIGHLIERIKNAGLSAGITLRPGTPLESVSKLLKRVDVVLVMTVEPGFGGQSFMADQVKKVSELHRLRSELGYNYVIQIDGGVTDVTKKQLTEADVLVAGSFVFKHKDGVQAAMTALRGK